MDEVRTAVVDVDLKCPAEVPLRPQSACAWCLTNLVDVEGIKSAFIRDCVCLMHLS